MKELNITLVLIYWIKPNFLPTDKKTYFVRQHIFR